MDTLFFTLQFFGGLKTTTNSYFYWILVGVEKGFEFIYLTALNCFKNV